MRLIVGQSDDVVAVDAVAAAIEMCDAQLSGLSPVAALVFASSSYEHADVLAGVARRWPGLPIVGCSTDGEMSSASGHHDDSVIVGLLVPWLSTLRCLWRRAPSRRSVRTSTAQSSR